MTEADHIELLLPPSTLASAEPERLVDAIAEAMTSPPSDRFGALAHGLGVPSEDLTCTVMSARATLMAAGKGRAFFQHELRGRIPMPEALRPEVDVWDEGTVPVWTDGVFVEAKYFSFRQDAPFAAYNTVHRRKWRAHELLHGAVGFFWRADATRFETYVGSRLNELLPVVHWYGLDEIFRPRCAQHRGTVLHREHCRECEAAARPYWHVEIDDAARRSAIGFVVEAQAHLAGELAACREEIRTGSVRETPRGHLNASTDAVGYLLGHWNRLSAWSFRTWADMFLRRDLDYFDDLGRYADHVEASADRLVGGAIDLSIERFEAARQRRVLQDVAYRTLLALEWLEPGREADLLDPLDKCAAAADALREGPADQADDALGELYEALGALRDELPDDVATPLVALGLTFWPAGRDPDFEIANLAEGVAQAAPLASDRVEADQLTAFADSPQFAQAGRLLSRFAAYLAAAAGDELALRANADLASLEAWIADDPHRDEDAERFAHAVDDFASVEGKDLRLNRTARRAMFGAPAVAAFADVEVDAERVELLAAYWRGELQLVIVDDVVRGVLDEIAEGRQPTSADTALALVEAGVVVWVPTVPNRRE